MKPLIGADPEFFVVRSSGGFVSGHIFECGTKIMPMATKHGFVQVDGLALEANIHPAETKDDFVSGILGVMSDLNEIVAKRNCKIIAQPVAEFDPKYMKKLPAGVKTLGCNPDFNAYTLSENPPPNASVPFRTGAGHIHVGWTEQADIGDFDHFSLCATLARQMDYFVGLRTLKFDPDNRRRDLYGKAGAFRPKHYGMEYRVPSSVWCSDTKLMEIVYDATVDCFEFTNAGGDLDEKHSGFAQACIDKNISGWDELNPEVAKEIGYAASVS